MDLNIWQTLEVKRLFLSLIPQHYSLTLFISA